MAMKEHTDLRRASRHRTGGRPTDTFRSRIDAPSAVGASAARLLIALAFLLAYFLVPAGSDKAVLWICLLAFYANFFAAVRRPDRVIAQIPTFASIEVLFLVFYFVIFYWPYQLFVLGDFDLSRSTYTKTTFASESNSAILLSTVGALAFSAGLRAVRSGMADKNADERSSGDTGMPAKTILFLLLIAIGIYLGAGFRSAGEGRYTGTEAGGSLADGLYTLILTLCMIAASQIFKPRSSTTKTPLAAWLGAAVAGGWSVRTLLVGDRNSFLLIALVVVGGYVTFRRSIGRVALVAMMLFGLLLYNAVAVVRADDSGSAGGLVSALFHPDAANPKPGRTTESDNSFDITTISLRATLAAVPSSYRFSYGKYKLIGVAGVVPYAGGLLVPSSTFSNTSELLTTVMLPPNAGWNVGTNVLSDSYIDFGPLGVPIVMFLLGLFAALVRRRIQNNMHSVRARIPYLLTLAVFAELPRYSVTFPLRILVWSALLYWLIRIISSASSGGSRSKSLRSN